MSRIIQDRSRFVAALALLFLLVGACNFPGTVSNEDIENTAAAETVAVQMTSLAETLAVETEEPPPTSEPTEEESPTATGTQTVTATSESACDRAQFISDVNYPDNTVVSPGSSFTKTWRIKNTGTCTWNADYDLVFDHGDSMGGPASVPIGNVAPGQTVDISVNLTAPASNGTYQGYWTLRNDDGVIFGIENSTSGTFWVKIKVGSTSSVLYSFVDHYCDAEWRSGAGVLPCPGTDTDSEGFVIKLTSPKLENGSTDDEPALELHPEWVNNGVISGLFPPIVIQEGDRFRALIGCLYGGAACNVKFQITYHADGGPLQLLGQWTEIYDGTMTSIDIDLSSLAGKSVEFALVVQANGASNQDWAFWLNPYIRR